MTRRLDAYDRNDEKPHIARCLRDMREARARGWTLVEVSQIPEPPVPMGISPAGLPDAVPDYGAGEDGGYQHTKDQP